jgi:NhaP-type Na+/H+ or K+/H+ antiporter
MDATTHVDKVIDFSLAKSALHVWNRNRYVTRILLFFYFETAISISYISNFIMLYVMEVAHILQRIRWITLVTSKFVFIMHYFSL